MLTLTAPIILVLPGSTCIDVSVAGARVLGSRRLLVRPTTHHRGPEVVAEVQIGRRLRVRVSYGTYVVTLLLFGESRLKSRRRVEQSGRGGLVWCRGRSLWTCRPSRTTAVGECCIRGKKGRNHRGLRRDLQLLRAWVILWLFGICLVIRDPFSHGTISWQEVGLHFVSLRHDKLLESP